EPPSDPPDDRGNPLVDFRSQKRSNKTHASRTDPEARLMRKGNDKEARLAFMAHALMENRNGLLADLQTTEADGYAERDAGLKMLDRAADRGFRPKTVAADKLHDVRGFVADLRLRGLTPHVAQNTSPAPERGRRP